jgi:hypothetical protein
MRRMLCWLANDRCARVGGACLACLSASIAWLISSPPSRKDVHPMNYRISLALLLVIGCSISGSNDSTATITGGASSTSQGTGDSAPGTGSDTAQATDTTPTEGGRRHRRLER